MSNRVDNEIVVKGKKGEIDKFTKDLKTVAIGRATTHYPMTNVLNIPDHIRVYTGPIESGIIVDGLDMDVMYEHILTYIGTNFDYDDEKLLSMNLTTTLADIYNGGKKLPYDKLQDILRKIYEEKHISSPIKYYTWEKFNLEFIGCKWDMHISDSDIIISENTETNKSQLNIHVATPNLPPDKWFAAIVKKYRDLDFRMISHDIPNSVCTLYIPNDAGEVLDVDLHLNTARVKMCTDIGFTDKTRKAIREV